MAFKAEDVLITVGEVERGFDVNALWRGRRLGYAWCNLVNNRVRISDLKVTEHFHVLWPWRLGAFNLPAIPGQTIAIRGRGIGTLMLQSILEKAVVMGAKEVWGCVVQHDFFCRPSLLNWYQRHGFTLSESDNECILGTVKKISKIIGHSSS